MNTRKALATLILSTAVLLLASCSAGELKFGRLSFGSVRLGMVGTNIPGNLKFSYQVFDGFETQVVSLMAGQELSIRYDVKVSQGQLSLELVDAEDNVIWQEAFSADQQGQVTIQAAETNRYHFYARGEQAGGSFDVSWTVY